MPSNETSEARFKRLAPRRTRAVLKALRLLSNCSLRKNYSYTEEEVDKIFNTIQKQLREARESFRIRRDEEFEL